MMNYKWLQKIHVLEVCDCLLSLTSHGDLLHEKTIADSFDFLGKFMFSVV